MLRGRAPRFLYRTAIGRLCRLAAGRAPMLMWLYTVRSQTPNDSGDEAIAWWGPCPLASAGTRTSQSARSSQPAQGRAQSGRPHIPVARHSPRWTQGSDLRP